ncbi:hypothetical protein PHLCEN_2v376 [Hermanssonia centrifuga]|nr:hypothetical protein PHLCEN_2v5822 [Hermanssonia centrifuga]PSS37775.1 hypothetical protein PHLCEN_2v376 [Hermanssonia centrifuga]
MSLHETSHYWMDPNDTISDKEWGTTLLYTPGYGRVRLGPEHRVFVVSYFHQLHCLRGIQGGIVFPGRDEEVRGTYEHVQHCLNYLRQTFLCTAADMLEKGDFMENSFEPGTLGDDLVCQDWEVLLRAMRDNYDEFVEWNQKWN